METRLYIAATGNIQADTEGLYLMNADGSHIHPLLPDEIPARETIRLDPSPDGTRILWGVERGDSVAWLMVDIQTGDIQTMEDTSYIQAWSPDGSQLAESNGKIFRLWIWRRAK